MLRQNMRVQASFRSKFKKVTASVANEKSPRGVNWNGSANHMFLGDHDAKRNKTRYVFRAQT